MKMNDSITNLGIKRTDGVCGRLQRQANQEIIPVPFFALLKHLPFKPLKRRFIEESRKMRF
jgi:hypothetical protein